jgi:hypothetical protein
MALVEGQTFVSITNLIYSIGILENETIWVILMLFGFIIERINKFI